jgi:gag-polypeptide of LTR copia-type
MDSSSYKFPKLKGSSNWEIWSLRASAVLTQKGYIAVMRLPTMVLPTEPTSRDPSTLDEDQNNAQNLTQETYRQELVRYQNYMADREAQSYQAASLIRLLLEDGPLLQTRNINDANLLWNRLQALYEPSGFSSEFLISRELFSTTLDRCKGSIEDYLTRIRRLTDELAAKQLAIPNKVIAAYTLSNLGPEWENTVAIISQSYRSQNGDIDLLALFSQLIDESRRRKAIQHPEEMVMTTQARPTRPIRPKCLYCKKLGHKADKCWEKHPHLQAKKQPKTELYKARNQPERPSKEAYIAEEEIALHSSIPEDIGTWYLDSAATSHISAYKGLF